MNTLENTVSMMELLPEEDLIEIQSLTKKLFNLRNADNPFQPLSKQEILKELQISREQTMNGQYKDMDKALEGIREKYGL
ncbi:MAG: hypothetical protein NC094_08750 [Bacteroidales bacterium]|nr:hypothetical protein [Lachnoclostridium sp.]MCM1385531.1 hypothetical protein [Lachnoclostridium sp.]MCM1465493.1 hypothetical protein [Bacteroidales bacterium]